MKGPSGLPTSDAGKSSESILARIALLRFLSLSATLPPFMRRERDRLLPRTFANASESSLIAESLLVPSVCESRSEDVSRRVLSRIGSFVPLP